MKIVQIGKYYHPFVGGIENNTKQCAEILAEDHGSEVIAMRRGRGPYTRDVVNGVSIHRLPSFGRIWRQEITGSPLHLIRELQADIIHFHAPNPLLTVQFARAMNRLPDVRLVITHHADLARPRPIRAVYLRYYRQLLDRADRICAYTSIFAAQSRELKSYEHKMVYIPHCTELGFDPAAKGTRIEPGRLHIGFIGRIERWKGVDVLIDAVADDPSLVLHVAGEGGYERGFRERIRNLGLSDRTHFYGQVTGSAKRDFFGGIDTLVLPSLTPAESFGQVLVEAQLCDTSIIASDLPTGIQEICDHGRAGLLFQPGEAVDLRRALEVMKDDARRMDLRSRGRNHAEEHFRREAVAPRLKSLFAGLR